MKGEVHVETIFVPNVRLVGSLTNEWHICRAGFFLRECLAEPFTREPASPGRVVAVTARASNTRCLESGRGGGVSRWRGSGHDLLRRTVPTSQRLSAKWPTRWSRRTAVSFSRLPIAWRSIQIPGSAAPEASSVPVNNVITSFVAWSTCHLSGDQPPVVAFPASWLRVAAI